jgi:hypothetical protein
MHSLLRWFALVAIVIAIAKSFKGMTTGSSFGKSDNRWSLLTLIAFHLQLVLGLVIYFLGNWHLQLGNMADKVARFYSLEHLVAMLIAITLVTLGRVRSKKAKAPKVKHRRVFVNFLIALIIVLLNIPWPFREAIGRPWFPGL